jgi:peptidoglycan/LPS O-acetylase OafA/YrhL
MEHQSFCPRSTRNRIALMLGLFSLILFFAWNLMPHYEWVSDTEFKRAGFVFQSFWPEIINDLVQGFQISRMSERSDIALFCLLSIFQVVVMLSIIPAWKLWQSRLILRFIPAFMIIICGLILSYYLLKNIERPVPHVITFIIMDANIFSTALSLLLFKNEYTEPDPHDIISTE